MLNLFLLLYRSVLYIVIVITTCHVNTAGPGAVVKSVEEVVYVNMLNDVIHAKRAEEPVFVSMV